MIQFLKGIAMHLVNCDCNELLRTLAPESVDLVLVDPPYGIGYDKWDQWGTPESYLAWSAEWTKSAWNSLRPGRMFCVWGTLKSDTFLRYKLEILARLPNAVPQSEIIWSYNWGGRTKKNFGYKHEFIWCYSKGEDFLFNSSAVEVARKTKKNPRTGLPFERGTVPTCVWEQNNHTTSKEFCRWHSTQKPLALLERLILAYTNLGDSVLDCFSGSGSTAIAANRTNRKFIGSEIDPEYYQKSLTRIAELS